MKTFVARSEKGELTATMDSPDQGVKGIPTTAVAVADAKLKFDVPQILGSERRSPSAT